MDPPMEETRMAYGRQEAVKNIDLWQALDGQIARAPRSSALGQKGMPVCRAMSGRMNSRT